MPTKIQAYSQMADHAATQITGSYQGWTEFLQTAARLYKYPYNEQLMIYAQRPEATACAEYDFWNNRMGRYVRRGSKGIALIDASGDRPRLKYVFDVSDTGGHGKSSEQVQSPGRGILHCAKGQYGAASRRCGAGSCQKRTVSQKEKNIYAQEGSGTV